tara:strand:- start:11850 stop:13274 length:1425 start_codon:yes stop_codon:yes gene_type:complete
MSKLQNIIVRGGAQYIHPDFIKEHKDVLREISSQYRLKNPEWIQAHRLRNQGRYIELPDEWVKAFKRLPVIHPWGNGIQIPRCIDLTKYVEPSSLRVVDKTSFPDAEKLSVAEHIKLRDYQTHAIGNLKASKEGVVVAPCGAGKTTIGVGTIAALDTPALVLVHTLDLAKQWADRCEQQLNFRPSIVGGGTNELEKGGTKRIVVATFQTLSRWLWTERYNFGKQFGLLIVDECHHVPANTFCETLMTMPQRYRLGLTATPERQDGLSDILHWHLGDVLHEIKTEDLVNRGLVCRPRIEQLHTGWKIPEGRKRDWVRLISDMCSDNERTQFILDKVDILVRNEGRQVLVLSDRVQHCKEMAEELSNEGLRAVALVGTLSKKKRAELLESADKREIDVIFATCIADEGLDLPGLDTVFLTVPTKALGRIQQRIGRIMRVKEGKQTPVVFDVVDDSPVFNSMARKRIKLYRSLGCEV